MGCCGAKGKNQQSKKDNATSSQPVSKPTQAASQPAKPSDSAIRAPIKPAYTNQQAENKRKELRQNLAQGSSRPPQPYYPHLQPVSNIQ